VFPIERAGRERTIADSNPLRRSRDLPGTQAVFTVKRLDAHPIQHRLHDSVRQSENRERGNDLTVITYGATVPRSLQAAQKIEREQNVSVELIDLRTLKPVRLGGDCYVCP